jgi:hypothetical protein
MSVSTLKMAKKKKDWITIRKKKLLG